MKKIDLDEILFKNLREDYNKCFGLLKLQNGFDYMESMVKFLGCLSISIVKNSDKNIYEKILLENFKISPSLGDFKSLATISFSKNNKKNTFLLKDDLYCSVEEVFIQKNISIEVDTIESILRDINENSMKRYNNLWYFLEEYIVGFRNKIKGHGASFKENDQIQVQKIMKNINSIITILELKIKEILNLEGLNFYILSNNESDNTSIMDVICEYVGKKYNLSPFLIYLKCTMYSCQNEHKHKLFFYNDGRASKSYYLDYCYNHYYFSNLNEVENNLKNIEKIGYLNSSSDNYRQQNLLDSFIGRDYELNLVIEHILKNYKLNKSTALTIIGNPGTGKSAFISKLFDELTNIDVLENNEMCTYIFYAKKFEMSDNENDFFYNSLSQYFSSIGIKMANFDNIVNMTVLEKLKYLFSECNLRLKDKIIVLAIDGLDEFKNPEEILSNIPFDIIPDNFNIIFSTRPYLNILSELEYKLLNSNLCVLNKEEYIKTSASIVLNHLEKHHVEYLINQVLTKDIERNSIEYREIQDEIYEKSEGLPLYVHFISNNLIEFNPLSKNIKNEVLKFAKYLPSGLDSFYNTAFKNLDTISSQILYILYFSSKSVDIESFYQLIIAINFKMDRKEFKNKYFSKVEIFLKKDFSDKYSFYHLSVKEAIKNYFINDIKKINFEETINLNNQLVDKNFIDNSFKDIYYLKENSDLFAFLSQIKDLISIDNENKFLVNYKESNGLYIYYQFILFKIFQINDYLLSNDIKIEINYMDKMFRTIKNPELEDTKNFLTLLLLTNNYDLQIYYSNYYENQTSIYLINLFFQDTKKLKDTIFMVKNSVSNELKFILCINKYLLQNCINEIFELWDSMDKYNKNLAAIEIISIIPESIYCEKIIENIDNKNKILCFIELFKNNYNNKYIDNIFNLLENCTNEEKIDLIKLLIEKIDIKIFVNKILIIISDIKNKDTQIIELFDYLIKKIGNNKNILDHLELFINDKNKSELKFELLLSLYNITENNNYLEQAINCIDFSSNTKKENGISRLCEKTQNIDYLIYLDNEIMQLNILSRISFISNKEDVLTKIKKFILGRNYKKYGELSEKFIDKILKDCNKDLSISFHERLLKDLKLDDRHPDHTLIIDCLDIKESFSLMNKLNNDFFKVKDFLLKNNLKFHEYIWEFDLEKKELINFIKNIDDKDTYLTLYYLSIEKIRKNKRDKNLKEIFLRDKLNNKYNQILDFEIEEKSSLIYTKIVNISDINLAFELYPQIEDIKIKIYTLLYLFKYTKDINFLKEIFTITNVGKYSDLLLNVFKLTDNLEILELTLNIIIEKNEFRDSLINYLAQIIDNCKDEKIKEKIILFLQKRNDYIDDTYYNFFMKINNTDVKWKILKEIRNILSETLFDELVDDIIQTSNNNELLQDILDSYLDLNNWSFLLLFQKLNNFELFNLICEKNHYLPDDVIVDSLYSLDFIEMATNIKRPLGNSLFLNLLDEKIKNIILLKELANGEMLNRKKNIVLKNIISEEENLKENLKLIRFLNISNKKNIFTILFRYITDMKTKMLVLNYIDDDKFKEQLFVDIVEDLNVEKIVELLNDNLNNINIKTILYKKLKKMNILNYQIENIEDIFIKAKLEFDLINKKDKKFDNLTNINNIVVKLYECINFNFQEISSYVGYVNPEIILNNHYSNKKIESEYNEVLFDFIKLKELRNKAESLNDEDEYDDIVKKAEKLKDIILSNAEIKEKFIYEYNLSELKLKKTNLLDLNI